MTLQHKFMLLNITSSRLVISAFHCASQVHPGSSETRTGSSRKISGSDGMDFR